VFAPGHVQRSAHTGLPGGDEDLDAGDEDGGEVLHLVQGADQHLTVNLPPVYMHLANFRHIYYFIYICFFLGRWLIVFNH